MPLEHMEHYTRHLVRANSRKWFIYGDNLERRGLGRQAKACRYERNAIGIPTKRSPYVFLSDADFDEWQNAARHDMERALALLENRAIVVFPIHGIGTGRAELPTRAPRIYAQIRSWVIRLETYA